MPWLSCEIIFFAASEGYVAFPSVPFPQCLFPAETKSQLEKGSPSPGASWTRDKKLSLGCTKHLSVVIISIFSLSFLWRPLWGSASPLLQSQKNSFHCFILYYLVQNSFISLHVLLLSRIILLLTSCKKKSFTLLYTQTSAV